jgi:hypothetical protein
MPVIEFTAKVGEGPNAEAVVTMPKNASAQLPSRGMTLIKGKINGSAFKAVVEPDEGGSHWFMLREVAGIKKGDSVTISAEPSKDWPEPKVPAGVSKALAADKEAQAIWNDITPMARWDWIRWIGAAKQAETRQHRVDTLASRLKAGKRRPCCFDRNVCTLTDA